MVNHQDSLDLLFHALSDRTRRSLLAQLTKKECSVTELADPHEQSLAGISKHLKVLEEAKFVEKTKEGRTFRCRANLEPLKDVYAVLEELGAFWRKQLDSLERYLNEELGKESTNEKSRTSANTKSRRHKNNPR